MITIRDIRTIVTAPRGTELVVVKVETSEPGLYGVGCATFTQRWSAVVTAVNDFLKPLLVGKAVNQINDLWQYMMSFSYWRNGPVLNNAIAGVDEALWDIKGKLAGMPVYELLGGKCREGVAAYRHADGRNFEEVEQCIQNYLDQGYRYIRVHCNTYGGNMGIMNNTNGLQSSSANAYTMHKTENAPEGAYYDPAQYMRNTVELIDHMRGKFGYQVEFMHDVHERLTGIQALQLAKDLEPYKLFFLEDALQPEQGEWFEYIRKQTAVPLAMGELFVNPMEYKRLIEKRYIDYIRCHISMIGGLTPAIKLAHFADVYGVRTAWHGPFDLSAIGAAAQIHLDLVSPNFGVQEFSGFTPEEREVFPGAPEARNGYVYLNDKPGLGVDIDEEAAKKYPPTFRDNFWLKCRLPDGTCVRA